MGAVCGIRSLGAPVALPSLGLPSQPLTPMALEPLAHGAATAINALIGGWLPLWLPLIGSALLLHGVQRLLPALRP